MDKKIFDRIDIQEGDITLLKIDAIVNAANNSLLGGGGVDGAIHRCAGPALLAECKTIGGCPTGEARITKGYKLSAKYVIHTVGPIYSEKPEDSMSLSKCYKNSLELAVKNSITSIAFPAISCGVYGYPIREACKIAIDSVCEFIETEESIKKVVFILFSNNYSTIYREYLNSLKNS